MNETENDNRARARYRKRGIFPNPDDNRKKHLNDLSHRLIPSLSFYLFAIIAGFVFGVALLLDSKALVVLTLALLPFMGPFWGMALSCTSGSFSFFFKSFLKFLLAGGLFVMCAFSVGGIGRLHNQLSAETIQYFSSVQGLPMITVVICAFLTSIFISGKSDQLPLALSNGAMFGILLPFGIAGYLFGLQNGLPLSGAIQAGLTYSVIGIAASILGFLFRRAFSPRAVSFLMILAAFSVCSLFLLDYFNLIQLDFSESLASAKANVVSLFVKPTELPTVTPTNTVTATRTFTATLTSSPTVTASPTSTRTMTATFTETATSTITLTPVPPSATPSQTTTPTKTLTPTRTLPPTKTPTVTYTPSATIVYGIVYVPNDVGLLIRERPDFSANVLKSQYNGSLLEMIGETIRSSDGMIWAKVRTNDGLEGWVAQSTLRTATPMN